MAGKQILVLAGSPRTGGNTETLADAFIRGAQKNGNHVTKMDVAKLNIGGCRACNGCWNSQGNCVVRDDMKQLEPLFEKADVLVMAAPLYWSVVPAQLKAPIDRLYQYDQNHGGKHMRISEGILLTCGETEEPEDFRLIKDFFTMVCEFNRIKVRDIIAVPGINHKGDIEGHEALLKAELLGESI